MSDCRNMPLFYRAAAMAIAIGIAAAPIPVTAQDRTPKYRKEYPGTESQQIACTPDVFRLCFTSIPFVRAIVACLKENRQKLSPDCRRVFERRMH